MIHLEIPGNNYLILYSFQALNEQSSYEDLLDLIYEQNPHQILLVDIAPCPKAVSFLADLFEVHSDNTHIEYVFTRVAAKEARNLHAQAIRDILEEDAYLENACDEVPLTTIFSGEPYQDTLIISDPAPLGILGAIQAIGLEYEYIEDDALLIQKQGFFHDRSGFELWTKKLIAGFCSVPSYSLSNPYAPTYQEQNAKEMEAFLEIFFTALSTRSEAAALRLNNQINEYRDVAIQRAAEKEEVGEGIFLIDLTSHPICHIPYLQGILESSRTKIAVFKRSQGPICEFFAAQYSVIGLWRNHSMDLRKLVEGKGFHPEEGFISKTNRTLHVNEALWQEHVLPGLNASLHVKKSKSAKRKQRRGKRKNR